MRVIFNFLHNTILQTEVIIVFGVSPLDRLPSEANCPRDSLPNFKNLKKSISNMLVFILLNIILKGGERKNMRIPLMKYIACYLVFAMFMISIVPRVGAGFIPSEIIAPPQLDRTADLQKIQKVLETKMVRERLENLGFTESEIQKRLNQLSDEQIHNLALNIDQLKVGGNGLGVVIVILVIAILVVLLLQLTGHKVIVK